MKKNENTPSRAADWVDVGAEQELRKQPITEVRIDRKLYAISYSEGAFGAISGVCNHVGGPLGKGCLKGEYVECPWHGYKFHRATGVGEPGFESDQVPSYPVKVENGRVLINRAGETARQKKAHPHPLARPVIRAPGPLRVLGLSTTQMDRAHPRVSTSELLLEHALKHAHDAYACETKLIRIDELKFRHCEGYYSKAARACTWPCTITQMDPSDELERVYEGLVHWADITIVATPIRWGGASSLYYKLIERMNCVQNQITIAGRELIQKKTAAFIITGGQDGIQAVAGQMMSFFSELGFTFPPYPFIAHSRGWTAEDMERNVAMVQNSDELREGAQDLIRRAVETARPLVAQVEPPKRVSRGGRKAQRLNQEPQ